MSLTADSPAAWKLLYANAWRLRAPQPAMTHTTRRLAALLLWAAFAGFAQADTGATLYMQFGGTITGWNPVDDDTDPDNGPYYPGPEVNGLGGYAVNLQWPGHNVNGYGEQQYGVPLHEPGYGIVADAAVIGGYSAASLSFPSTATGSARSFGTAVSTWTLLPGVTLTIEGNLAGSARSPLRGVRPHGTRPRGAHHLRELGAATMLRPARRWRRRDLRGSPRRRP